MPASFTSDSFASILGKHSWFRAFYIKLTNFLLLKNITIKSQIKRWSRSKSNTLLVLDAGFGFGNLLDMFISHPKKYNVLGIDINPKLVADATSFLKEYEIKNIYCRTQNVMSLKDENAFDLCLCINLLNYIENDVQLFELFKNALKKNGMLFVFSPSNYTNNNDRRMTTGVHKDKKYREGYDIDEIKEKLKLAGFSKVRAKYAYGWPGMISWKLTTGIPSLLVKWSKLFYAILPFYVIVVLPFIVLFNLLDIKILHNKGKCIVVKAFK